MSPVIEVTNLNKRYDDGFIAVHDISFQVEAGECFCFLGPNGAGKTTTTEILEGYRHRTAGHASVLGHDPATGDPRMRERIGIVLQECGIEEFLTVSEVLDMYGSFYPRRRSAAELVALVELDAKENTRIGNLSGGQRRRLDVALALVGDPDLIFLDEPTTGFDPSARRSSWSALNALTELGKTVFLTTHFMDEAEALADRIAVVAGGRIVAEGTPHTLGGRDRAASTITAELRFDAPLPALPRFEAASVTSDGAQLTVRSNDPTRAMHQLTGWALEHGVELNGLTASQPTLEDVYLQLTSQEATR